MARNPNKYLETLALEKCIYRNCNFHLHSQPDNPKSCDKQSSTYNFGKIKVFAASKAVTDTYPIPIRFKDALLLFIWHFPYLGQGRAKKSKESKRIYNERVSSTALLTFCFCKTEFDYLGGLDSTKCKVKVEKSLLKAGESEFDAKC